MNNFQIIIPVNRETFLNNIVNFYSKTNIKIIIIHNLKINFDKYYSNNIKFYFSEKQNFLDRIYSALHKFDTEYSLLFSDDDFIFEESIIKCINFLETNSDFSSAQGLTFNFSYSDLASLEKVIGINSDLVKRETDSNFKNLRLFQALTYRYVDRLYSITKTKYLLDILDTFKPLMKNYKETWELYSIVCLSMLGRDFIDQNIGWLKGQHENNFHKVESNDFTTWIFNKNFLKTFYSCISEFSKKQNIKNFSFFYMVAIFFIFKLKILFIGYLPALRELFNYFRYKRKKKIHILVELIFLKNKYKLNLIKKILHK